MGQVLSSQDAGVLTLTLNRPEKLNAITTEMYVALVEGLSTAAADETIRAVLIDASGTHFTAGNDINDFMNAPALDIEAPGFQFIYGIHNFPKPLIASVQGMAVGIGTTMLLHCDAVFAEPQTEFSLPFVSLGLVPEAGSSYLLPQLVGHQRAAEILFSGESFSAAKAYEVGLVTQVSPDAAKLALDFAKKVAEQPPSAVMNTKALLKSRSHDAVSAVIEAEGQLFAMALQSDEAREAFMKFLSRKAR
ncbi:MAG: enoyl-CoA hydratase [Actinomycetota bacterium]